MPLGNYRRAGVLEPVGGFYSEIDSRGWVDIVEAGGRDGRTNKGRHLHAEESKGISLSIP
jgi:hypothetical protein